MSIKDGITLNNESKEFMNKWSNDKYLSFEYYRRWFLSKGLNICEITLGGYPLSRYIGLLEFGDVLKKLERFYSEAGETERTEKLWLTFYDAVKISNNFNDMRIFKDIVTKETFPRYAFDKNYSDFAIKNLH